MAGHIEARGISKLFGTFRALRDVSLATADGEFLTLLGPSGSGKTTFLMVLAGFEPPSQGALILDGRDMTALGPEERGFGMVFQGYALFPHMSVAENIAFPLKVRRRSARDISARVDEMIEMVKLGDHAHKRPAALSGGQQQRVALARALACEPPVLLLDEPFSALDKNLRGQMQDEIRRIHRELGTTFVFVTHDQSEALALSDHIAIFDGGQLQQFGTPDEVYERPQNRFVAEFLGDINILPAQFADHRAVVEGRSMRFREASRPEIADHLAVRPEHVRLQREPPADSENALRGRVADIVYLGSSVCLSLRSDGGNALTLNVPTAQGRRPFEPGAEVWATWDADKCFAI